MTILLEVRALEKVYPGVKAVDGVSFAIPKGICFGLLGPNGAGKTTTLEMIEGVTQPTAGEIRYQGEPVGKRFRLEAGIQFQSTALQDFLTVREALEMFANFYPHTADISELIRFCALEEFLDRDNRKLSGGQRQRLLLAIALVNDPQVVFLDEPTTGLDPQARRNFWELVQSIKQKGKTVVLTTHYMEEAYVLCDEIAIMDHGKIIAQGTPRTLLKEHFNESFVQLPEAVVAPLIDSLGAAVQVRDGMAEIATRDVNETIRVLLKHDIDLSGLHVRKPTLDDLFIELTGKALRG